MVIPSVKHLSDAEQLESEPQIIKKKPTISDVARFAKVGKTSVSRYLNGEFDALSEQMKARIELAVKALNFYPNQMARSLKRGGSKLIAYILPDITNPYSIEVLQGLEQACQDHGYTLLVCNTNKDLKKEQYYLQILLSYNVEGVILQALQENNTELSNCTFPIVLIDRKISDIHADFIGLDNIQSSTLATKHLITSGFEAALFITEPVAGISARQDRMQTFEQVSHASQKMIAKTIEITDPKGKHEQFQQELGCAIQAFCQKYPSKRKALIAVNGSVTLNVALAMKQVNLAFGPELGFVGFDDPSWAAVVGNGVTTIKQPTYQIGYSSFKCLLNRINGSKEPYQTILYPGELVIRQSTM